MSVKVELRQYEINIFYRDDKQKARIKEIINCNNYKHVYEDSQMISITDNKSKMYSLLCDLDYTMGIEII